MTFLRRIAFGIAARLAFAALLVVPGRKARPAGGTFWRPKPAASPPYSAY